MSQRTFFDRDKGKGEPDLERLILHALGEFQARGKVLVDRDLPLDRLRGAFRRAAASFDIDEPGDEDAANVLVALGARVRRVPTFFAKHPFRVTVPPALAERARNFYDETVQRQG